MFEYTVNANVILDRLLHYSKVFSKIGPSYRIKDKMKNFSDDV